MKNSPPPTLYLLGICHVATWSVAFCHFCCAPPRTVWLCLLYSLPLGSWGRQLDHPVAFCSSGWTNPALSVSPCLSHAPAPCSFGDPPLDSFQFVDIFFVLQCPRLSTVLCRQSHKRQMELGVVITSLDLLSVLVLTQPSIWLAFIAMRAVAHSSPSLFTGTPRTFSAKLLFTQSAPGCCMCLSYPRCRTSHVPSLNWKILMLAHFSSFPKSHWVTALPLSVSVAPLNLMLSTCVTTYLPWQRTYVVIGMLRLSTADIILGSVIWDGSMLWQLLVLLLPHRTTPASSTVVAQVQCWDRGLLL